MNQPLLAQTIISSMITPAFLILGAANLANIALTRLARTVDRARVVMGLDVATHAHAALWLARYARRARLAERAILCFFSGVALFVASCLSIAIDHYTGGSLTWLPVSLTIIGMVLLLGGAICLGQECRVASRQIFDEIAVRSQKSSDI
jgi:hypothetical protein